MLDFLKRITVPYHLSHWYTNLLAASPQIFGGIVLVFFCLPDKLGLPWSKNDLGLFEISSEFISVISNLGPFFEAYSMQISYAFLLIALLAGIKLILGLFTRLFSFIFLIPLVILSIFREFDGTWSYVPYFCYIAICILAIIFGSGRYGIDYLIAKGMKWL